MRLTQKLFAQNIGYHFKKHWLVQGKRVVRDTGAVASAKALGINIVDAKVVAFPKFRFPKLKSPPEPLFKTIKFDETHPSWHSEECCMFRDTNVLIEGLAQAQNITNSVIIENLPKSIEERLNNVTVSDELNMFNQTLVKTSFIFDAEQKKLAKRKDPLRPAWVFPREYGITDNRRNLLLFSKLLMECEKLAGPSISLKRQLIYDALFVTPLKKDDHLLQMEIKTDTLITAKEPILPFNDVLPDDTANMLIPDLYPMNCIISIPKENIYDFQDSFPMTENCTFNNPHTILLHFSPLDVRNLHETPITDSQFKSRSLMKAFTVALATARYKYGNSVTKLPKPIVIQSVQTTGKSFYFGVFQLNTLDLNVASSIKNIWYHEPIMIDLFSFCGYKEARPTLLNYNSNVFKYLYAFYGS